MGTQTLDATPRNGGQVPAIKRISGKKLAKALKAGTLSPDIAARLAHDLNTGHLTIGDLTTKQARQLTGALPADLAAVRRQMHADNGNGERVLYRQHGLTDRDVDAIVAKVGAERIMASLDRLTRPRCEQTTEMFSVAR